MCWPVYLPKLYLKLKTLIYIAHHQEQDKEAAELTLCLKQLEDQRNVSIESRSSILGGSEVEETIQSHIDNAHIVLVLCSVKYLVEQKAELDHIKKSDSFRLKKVIPIPLKPCYLRNTFLGNLMPLPRDSCYPRSAFDNSGFYNEIVSGVDEILERSTISPYRREAVQCARASSLSLEPSQESCDENEALSTEGLKSDERYFRVEGDSMNDLYEDRDIVKGKLINLREFVFKPHQVFVIRTRTQGYLTKYIHKIGEDEIFLASANSLHPTFALSKEEVISIWLVTACIKDKSLQRTR